MLRGVIGTTILVIVALTAFVIRGGVDGLLGENLGGAGLLAQAGFATRFSCLRRPRPPVTINSRRC
jgi:hypothetical protein